ncbi:hypothetical protein LXL04_020325 [Taraxacum kok-saghyz]
MFRRWWLYATNRRLFQIWGQFGHSVRPESIMQQWGYFWKAVQAWRWNLQKHNQWSRLGINATQKGSFGKLLKGVFGCKNCSVWAAFPGVL